MDRKYWSEGVGRPDWFQGPPAGRPVRLLCLLAAVLILASGAAWISAFSLETIPEGAGAFTFRDPGLNRGLPLKVFTYRSSSFAAATPILFVLHGNGRNAGEYRDQWVEIAERNRALLLVPEFSGRDFPDDDDYNMGRMFEMDAEESLLSPIPEKDWSYSLIEPIYEFVKRETGHAGEGYLIYGHSAGSQFVHRFLWMKPDARVLRAVCANAGWYTFPDFETVFPYGLRQTAATTESVKLVLAKPVTILLGEADTDPEARALRRTPEALRQGAHRLARGRAFFDFCRRKAVELDAAFGWRIETVPGVGHSNRGMAPAAERVLFPDAGGKPK